jgi:hypothetical protein
MNVAHRWRTVALVAAALFAGSVIGPPLVQAATAGLVTIQGSGGTNKANVTKAGQLQATEGGAGSAVIAYGTPNCSSGGFYTVPKGKALIVTGANFYNVASGPGTVNMNLYAGPRASPCDSLLTLGLSTSDLSLNQAFHPGIPVPAGDALGAVEINDSGSLQVYGYLVPAAAVPAGALRNLPSVHAGRAATISPSR